jgi:adenine-specific DNA-methyltransferase
VDDDDLMARTERRRIEALAALRAESQDRLGQFFTPQRAASLIASLPRLPQSGRLRVLDPGAGAGSLSAALVQRALSETPSLELEVVAVEIDPGVCGYLAATLADCEKAGDGLVRTRMVTGDYIALGTGALGGDETLAESFDVVIMNPPYAKLALRSWQRTAMVRWGVDASNLYAAFLALGASALKPGGQIVAITPRSFANGPYFEEFRRYLLRAVAIDRLHSFESRSTVFSDTGVLQENIVLSATRDGTRDKVLLTVSQGHTDTATEHVIEYDEMVRPQDPHQFLRISAGDTDTEAAEVMAGMPATLRDLSLHASTGRVVDFRSRPNLRDTPGGGDLPLIYPGNLRGGIIEWPRPIRKPQGFTVLAEKDRKLLLPPGCYVVVKRFSAKEERRRIVAAVWDPALNGDADVAFENHLNIVHANGTALDRDLAVGLSLWLNSTTVDNFFRTFSGHTQVNATDLRSLRFPSLVALRSLGRDRPAALPEQAEIDELIKAFLLPEKASL